MLADLPSEAITELARAAGPETGSLLQAVEVRHAGGEMRRSRPGNGALAAVDAEYGLHAVGMAATPQAAQAVGYGVVAVMSAMAPWAAGQTYLNFTETSRDSRGFFAPQAYERLRRTKAAADPADLIRANHPIPPARPAPVSAPARDQAVLRHAG